MRSRVRPLALLVAVASVLAVVATAGAAKEWSVVTATLLLALSWAAIVSAGDAFATGHNVPAPEPAGPDGRAGVAFLIRLGEERPDIARTSVLLAAEAGPVVVAATRHHDLLDDLGGAGVHEFVAPSMAAAINDAVRAIDTEAVLLLSAAAFPLGDACVLAATRVGDGIGWVTGTAPSFNNDRYAPGERELMSARARSAGRAVGLVTWEPDATIVRTSLLRAHPFEPGRPDGAWLRDRAADGWSGTTFPEAVAVRAAPADAPVFWPTQTSRRRGAVADLAGATNHGSLVSRAIAFGALLRELYAYPVGLWLFATVLIGRSGRFPLSVSPVTFFAACGVLAAARWVSSRLAYGVGLHPVDEAREAAYDVPGSVLALLSALTRRVRPVRFEFPDQPLLWAALAVTLTTTIPLLDRRATTSAVGVAVGLTVAALVAAWVFALRAFGARGWDRASYRLPIDRPAAVAGLPARTLDASPSGLGIVGFLPDVTRGDHVVVSVEFDESSVSVVRGRVSDVRRARDQVAVGVALDLDAAERAAWVHRLFRSVGVAGCAPMLPLTPAAGSHLRFDRERVTVWHRLASVAQIGAVGAVSVVVAGALLVALLGLRPMVVRSGSMVPTLHVGDVVLADWVPVDRIHVGEVVTYPGVVDRPELITHRVEHVEVRGGTVFVATKGDANPSAEQWSEPRGALVGHVVWSFPKVGRALLLLGESTTRWVLLAATAAILFGAAVVRGLRRRGAGRAAVVAA